MFLLGEFHGHLSLWVPFKHFYKEFQSVVSKIIQWLNLKVMSDFWNLKSWPECRGKKMHVPMDLTATKQSNKNEYSKAYQCVRKS